MNQLGIVLVASPFDWLFAKGAIASCRYFMPDSRITLIVDGELDTTHAESIYDLEVIRKQDIDHPELRRLGFGWGTTKLLAFWYGRNETFLYLDSDAVVWGNLAGKVQLEGYDYVVSIRKSEPVNESSIRTWFFEIPFVEKYFPDWDWKASATEFFCPGVFAGRQGAFALEDYLEVLRLNERCPGQFKFGDMGFHNLMVFRGKANGSLRVATENFQVIFPEHPIDALKQRFRFKDGEPLVVPGDEQVLHMPDKKPLLDGKECYSEPMTHFRLKYLSDTEGITGEAAMARLRTEDAEYHSLRARFLRREKQAKIRRLLCGHPGEWRKLGKKFGLGGSI